MQTLELHRAGGGKWADLFCQAQLNPYGNAAMSLMTADEPDD
jgi:hypothetical protein